MLLQRTDSLPDSPQYEGEKLIYVARTRNGFTPVTRAQLFKKFKFVGLREDRKARDVVRE